LATAVGLWAVNQAHRETDRQRHAAVTERDAKEVALKGEQQARAEADRETVRAVTAEKDVVAQRDRAEANLAEAGRRLRLAERGFAGLVGGVQRKLADRAGTQAIQAELLTEAVAGLNELLDTIRQNKDANPQE